MLLFFCFGGVNAQPVNYVNIKKINQENGLSSPNIRKIVQDSYGFMWFATQDGLNRYDGNTMVHFNSTEIKEGRKTIGSDFRDIVVDKSGRLWAIDAYGALNEIDTRTCKIVARYQINQAFNIISPLWYTSLYLNGNHLLISSDVGVICSFDIVQKRVLRWVTLSKLLQKPAFASRVWQDNQKRIWTLLDGVGIAVLDSSLQRVEKMFTLNDLTNKPSQSLNFLNIFSYEDKVIVTSEQGLIVIDSDRLNVISNPSFFTKLPAQIKNTKTYGSFLDKHCLYLSTDVGLYRYEINSSNLAEIKCSRDVGDMIWLSYITAIFIKDNTLWLGNPYGIALIRNLASPFTAFTNSFDNPVVKLIHCFNLKAFSDSILFSCAPNGLFAVNLNTSVISTIDKNGPYYQVFTGPNHDIISCHENGIYIARGQRKIPAASLYPELDSIRNDFIIASASINDSLFFLASQNGKGIYVWRFNRGTVEIINTNTAISLKSNRINNFLIDNKNRLIIVCEDVVSVYDFVNATIEHKEIYDHDDGIPASVLMDIVKVSNGYFLAVYGKGLIQVDSEFRFIKTISFAQGLINTGIYKIYNYRDSVLITGSNNGLFVYDINSGKVRRFTVQDGLHSNNFDETSGSALNGIIYLGGIGGFTRIIPSQLMSDTLKPTCFFSDIEIKMPHGEIDTLNTHCEKLIVAKDYRQVTINFASPYFSNYESILYMYKMGYSNEEWITAGRQNSITITGIKPGNYTLYVKAVNSDGIQSDVIKLDLYFQPKWYQTWWFQSLLFLLFAVIVYRIYKYRIRQIRKEERLRQRIAGDLHDDIGSTLNSIKVYANLALSQPQQHEHLINVKQNTQEAISGLRDVIWVLDDREDTIEQLSIRISQFAKPLCAANHITFTADINPDLYGTKLGKEQKRNIYLTLKESINNSIKYSESSKIDFIIERNGQQINFIIKDNGKGFDTTKPSHGNGLKNIYSRAKQAKYKAFIESAPGQGTTITLTN